MSIRNGVEDFATLLSPRIFDMDSQDGQPKPHNNLSITLLREDNNGCHSNDTNNIIRQQQIN